MKFCEKLVKLRKDNNLSQEQLADRLGVSRQAVSKWESSLSVPNMEMMMQICKVLNCNLEDLIDDGINGKKNNTNDKINFKCYYNDFLDFITKTFNMFWSMRLIEKVKCILEMIFISLVIYIVWGILFATISNIFYPVLDIIPYSIRKVIDAIFRLLYAILGLCLGVMLVLHIFKIRYLDYFITIEDSNVSEKSVESPISDNNKYEKRQFLSKNKIIIRDPKHSSYNFFDFLAKMVVLFLKFIVILCAIPCIMAFVLVAFIGSASLFYLGYSILFLGIFIASIGALGIDYFLLEFMYHFVFELKNYYKRSFIILIVSLLSIGIGSSVSIITYINLDTTNYYEDASYTTFKYNIDYSEDTSLEFLSCRYCNIEYVVDNNRSDILVEVSHPEFMYVYFSDYNDGELDNYYFDYFVDDYLGYYKMFLKLIKEGKRINCDRYVFEMKVKANQEIIDKLVIND